MLRRQRLGTWDAVVGVVSPLGCNESGQTGRVRCPKNDWEESCAILLSWISTGIVAGAGAPCPLICKVPPFSMFRYNGSGDSRGRTVWWVIAGLDGEHSPRRFKFGVFVMTLAIPLELEHWPSPSNCAVLNFRHSPTASSLSVYGALKSNQDVFWFGICRLLLILVHSLHSERARRLQTTDNMPVMQQMLIDESTIETQETTIHHFTPTPRLSRSDVHFPLTTPRKRAPSITSIADVSSQINQDGQTIGHLTIRGREASPIPEADVPSPDDVAMNDESVQRKTSVQDLPLEVQGKILDYIFGEVHAVNTASTSMGGTSVSHNMRHPRRKAVSALALVSVDWRDLVQSRIYRHIKIKGTRPGIEESTLYFYKHGHLTKHVRHIEFWVPVWGDKAAAVEQQGGMHRYNHTGHMFADEMSAHELLGFQFNLSHSSATLAEIFGHINEFFPMAKIFTLEGGHCKRSNMIRHFPNILFKNKELEKLPNIRTFAIRGAWNVMRCYSDWQNIEKALPNVEEWHCGFAKPRQEAYLTINEILLKLPFQLRHVNVSLDGMYSKDDTTLGSNSLLPGMHLCEQLGKVAPYLESLTYTGKVCECFWSSAVESALEIKSSRLQALEIVVKSCCRQRITNVHHETGERIIEELGGIMADGAGITNLVFIRAFERLVLGAVNALPVFSTLDQIRIRYIDLDSPCALLNPYWHLKGNRVLGIWNEEIVERLGEVRIATMYDELGDGLNNDTLDASKKEDDSMDWRNASSVVGGGPVISPGGGLYPKKKPKSIKTSSYRVIAETRGS